MNTVTAAVRGLEWLNERLGRAMAWLVLLMILDVFAAFILRYVFSADFDWLRDSYTWMHGLVFMIGAGYTLLHDGYLRVDILYRSRSTRFKAAADLLGGLLFLIPFTVAVAWVSWSYVAAAWARFDGVGEIGSLPGAFLFKTVILAFCVLVGLQGIAIVGRSILTLRGHKAPKQG